MVRLGFLGFIVAIAIIIWVVRKSAAFASGNDRLATDLRSQTQGTMQTAAKAVNWMNEQWEKAKSETIATPASDPDVDRKLAQFVDDAVNGIAKQLGQISYSEIAVSRLNDEYAHGYALGYSMTHIQRAGENIAHQNYGAIVKVFTKLFGDGRGETCAEACFDAASTQRFPRFNSGGAAGVADARSQILEGTQPRSLFEFVQNGTQR